MYIHNYIYADGNYVKLFLWNTSMNPLASTVNTIIQNG